MRSMAKLLYRRDKWFTTGLEELLQSWCCASDLESFEHIAKEATRFVAGPVSASSFGTWQNSHHASPNQSCDDLDLIDDVRTLHSPSPS